MIKLGRCLVIENKTFKIILHHSKLLVKRLTNGLQWLNFIALFTLMSYIIYINKYHRLRHIQVESIQQFKQSNHVKDADIAVILLWTGWFFEHWPIRLGGHTCSNCRHLCYFTIESKYYSMADAVVFHATDMHRMVDTSLPNVSSKPIHQRWVYYTMENPPISIQLGIRVEPRDEKKFDWIMSYARDADVYTPYGHVIPGRYGEGFDPSRNYAHGRSKMIVMVASRCYPSRMKMVSELQRYVDVDIYGECGIKCSRNLKCWNRIKDNYKFYLSFENEVCKDYITEKLYNNAFGNYLIPIMISGANYSDGHVIPPNSFIDALQFKNVQKLASFIKKVADDDNLYNSYFQWRDHYDIKIGRMKDTLCSLCRKVSLQKRLQGRSRPYANLHYILGNHDGNCKQFPDPYSLNAVRRNFSFYQ